jgi:hypothetical protein
MHGLKTAKNQLNIHNVKTNKIAKKMC